MCAWDLPVIYVYVCIQNMSMSYAPTNSLLQLAAAKKGGYPPVPKVCVVTGGTGFVGLRLVEMLVERGAEKVGWLAC